MPKTLWPLLSKRFGKSEKKKLPFMYKNKPLSLLKSLKLLFYVKNV